MGTDKAVCQRYRNGHFLFRHIGADFHYAAFIDRTDSIQIETDQITGDVSTLAVKWVNDCEYQLRLINSTKPYPDSIQHLRKTVSLYTEILGGTDRYYLFRTSRQGSDFTLTDTLWVHQ